MLGSLRLICKAIDDNYCCVVESALQTHGIFLLKQLQFEIHPLKSIAEAISYNRMYVAVASVGARAAGFFLVPVVKLVCVLARNIAGPHLFLVDALRRPALRGRFRQLDRGSLFVTPSFNSHSLVNTWQSTGLYARSPPIKFLRVEGQVSNGAKADDFVRTAGF